MINILRSLLILFYGSALLEFCSCLWPAGLRTSTTLWERRIRTTAASHASGVPSTPGHRHRAPAHGVRDPESAGRACQRLHVLLRIHLDVLLPATRHCCPHLLYLSEFDSLVFTCILMIKFESICITNTKSQHMLSQDTLRLRPCKTIQWNSTVPTMRKQLATVERNKTPL